MRLTARSQGNGLCGLSRRLDQTEGLDRALRAGAEQVRDEAREALQGDDEGGALTRSLQVERGRPLSYRVVSKAPIAWFREFGALRRAQRPWLQPALERARPPILARVRQALGRMVRSRSSGSQS
ncbi:bacteriophage HK97-gp10 putative tail-component [Dichotomicrobium thermohalophilum]|uniref:Bacteriophage HK97-gp10 putative tail-component n=1 Tax=Dichotomicrobium thermohalophilum TaxID=933063 RepID=A0A397QAD0_9HYPH|nr:bacteriophage HK97-gp10 putative tail-component [Dichotomicrobium thermohalophilum]